MLTLAEQVCEYVVNARYEDLPKEVVEHTKRIVLDSLGVAIAGSGTASSKAARSVACEEAATPQATILRYGDKVTCASAAFVNCVFAHALDFNDDLAGCQLGAIAPPSALALGERIGATGKEIILAIVLGYDVMTRVADAANSQELYLRGFQPTALCGAFATAAIAGKLLNLDVNTLANAFGIAGSYAGGVVEFLKHGTDTKRLHVGKAAHGGIVSALLAQYGMTGPITIFEGERGFFRAFCGSFFPSKLVEDLGKRYDILDTSVKLYPFCDGNATPVEAALEIVRQERLPLQEIESIHARVKTFLVQYVIDYHGDRTRKFRPKTMLDAQMSLPYCMALALLRDGQISVEDFIQGRYDDPEVLRLADKVDAEADPELDKIPLRPMSMPSLVNIRTRGGRTYTRRVDYQKGDPRNPFNEGDYARKFRACVMPILGSGKTEEALDRILALDTLEDVKSLLAVLVAKE